MAVGSTYIGKRKSATLNQMKPRRATSALWGINLKLPASSAREATVSSSFDPVSVIFIWGEEVSWSIFDRAR